MTKDERSLAANRAVSLLERPKKKNDSGFRVGSRAPKAGVLTSGKRSDTLVRVAHSRVYKHSKLG